MARVLLAKTVANMEVLIYRHLIDWYIRNMKKTILETWKKILKTQRLKYLIKDFSLFIKDC